MPFLRPVPPKFNRRPNRFDVVTEADGLAAFTAPSDAELTQWLQVRRSRLGSRFPQEFQRLSLQNYNELRYILPFRILFIPRRLQEHFYRRWRLHKAMVARPLACRLLFHQQPQWQLLLETAPPALMTTHLRRLCLPQLRLMKHPQVALLLPLYLLWLRHRLYYRLRQRPNLHFLQLRW